MTMNTHRFSPLVFTIALGLLYGCGDGSSGAVIGGSTNSETSGDTDDSTDSSTDTDTGNTDDTDSGSTEVDITNAIFNERSGDCGDYISTYYASVSDIQRGVEFDGNLIISANSTQCVFSSNNIPNHNMNDASASFASHIAEINQAFTMTRTPTMAVNPTSLSQHIYNGIMLNGVPLDIKSAGCYQPDDPDADSDGNTSGGCTDADDWILDPLSTPHKFGADSHNAHTQPNGSYHYHGDPNAMHDDNPGSSGSPVIGFAADGYPIYGNYFYDANTGQVRKALSGYTLKTGARPDDASSPGGSYTGIYVDDWEFTNAGDLDVCNGMEVDGQYGYYVTDSYPWVIACHSGTPHTSFTK